MYEKILRALRGVTPEDEDEGITVVADWIVERIRATGARPSSRAVRKRVRQYCRNNGHEVSTND